jgi:hypothetical protein
VLVVVVLVLVLVVVPVVLVLALFALSAAQPAQRAATASKVKRAKVLRIEIFSCNPVGSIVKSLTVDLFRLAAIRPVQLRSKLEPYSITLRC